jgi:hypothetical protein
MTSSMTYLLSLNPQEAIVKMLNDQNGTNYPLNGFDFGLPVQIGDTTTQVTLTPKPKPNSFFDLWPTGDPVTVTYDRLDLNVFLRNVLTGYQVTLPASTQNVLNEITTLIGQKFYIDDIVLTEVTRSNGAAYALAAKTNSLRFVNQIVLDLVNLTSIGSVLNANALATVDDESQVVFPLSYNVTYLNATDFRSYAEGFEPGDLAQEQENLIILFNNVVPEPNSNFNFGLQPWYVDSTPGPYNLYGSTVAGYVNATGVNPAIPGLETGLVVNINGLYCTNFQSGSITIPYTAIDFDTDGYVAEPRCLFNGVVSLSNGSAWNVYLNGFTAGQVIQSFQASPPVTMDGTNAWVATEGVPLPTNLYGATVVYNGQLRDTDLPAATQGLDRLLVVEMGVDNAIWQGQYPFYYASPITLTWNGFPNLQATLNSQYHYDFTPNAGNSPFTYAVVSGTLPPGTSFSGSALDGTLTTAGSYTFGLAITDSTNVTVLFNVTVVVGTEIQPLTITGVLPNAVLNTSYEEFLTIAGGLMPYSQLGIIAGSLPPGLSISLEYNTILISGTPTQADTYPFAVSVSSSDGQQVSASYAMTVSETYQPLTVTGTYAEGVVGNNYTSSLFITGGSGVYDVTVISGSLPPGLSLVLSTVGTAQAMLEGTPTTAGTYSFTVQVYSNDGQLVTSAQSIVIVASSENS